MKTRRNFLPRTVSDISATAFLFVAIPITYFFEFWVVIPELSGTNTLAYWLHFCVGSFILFNILSNMLAVMMCNTSIVGENVTAPARPNRKLWKLCSVCETVTPPRSWHCNTCNVCILKRDHHCFFTGEMPKKATSDSLAPILTHASKIFSQAVVLAIATTVTSLCWSSICLLGLFMPAYSTTHSSGLCTVICIAPTWPCSKSFSRWWCWSTMSQ